MAKKYANTKKSGSKNPKKYDPKTTTAPSSGKPGVTKKYNPPKGTGPNNPN